MKDGLVAHQHARKIRAAETVKVRSWRCLVVLLLPVVFGCAERNSAVSVQSDTAKVVYPLSGGEMVFISGDAFRMGGPATSETPVRHGFG